MGNKVVFADKVFPIIEIGKENNVMVSANGDITIGFEATMPEIFTISEGEMDNLTDGFINAIKYLPVGYMVHKQDWYIESKFSPQYSSETIKNGNVIAIENERHFNERSFIEHKCFIFITKPLLDSKTKSSKNSSVLKKHLVPKNSI